MAVAQSAVSLCMAVLHSQADWEILWRSLTTVQLQHRFYWGMLRGQMISTLFSSGQVVAYHTGVQDSIPCYPPPVSFFLKFLFYKCSRLILYLLLFCCVSSCTDNSPSSPQKQSPLRLLHIKFTAGSKETYKAWLLSI